MAWATIRRATREDVALLEKRAKAFALRHRKVLGNKGHAPELSWMSFVEDGIAYYRLFGNADEVGDANRLSRLWLKVVTRALGDGATGIAYGHVGYEAP